MNKLSEILNNSFKDEYREIMDIWKEIDKKTQINLTLSGVLLTILGTYVNQQLSIGSAQMNCFHRCMITATIIVLLCSAISCIFALWTRRLDMPPLGAELSNVISDILHEPDASKAEIKKAIKTFYRKANSEWPKINEAHHKARESKTLFLEISTFLLITALTLIGTLTITRIYS